MSVILSNEDLQRISLEFVQYPELRLLAVQSVDKAVETSELFLSVDNSNKPFTDAYRNLATIYSTELNILDEDGLTSLPNEALFISSAQGGETLFPATPPNVWTNLQPELQLSNNGNPRIAFNGTTEFGSITAVRTQLDGIKNGIAGSGSSQVETVYTIGDPLIRVDDVTSFSVGEFIFAINGSDALFAEITAINQDAGSCSDSQYTDEASCTSNMETWTQPTSGDLVLNVLQAPASNIPIGTNVISSIAGFSNAEREESTSLTPSRQAQLDVFKQLVDNSIQTYETFLTGTYRPNLVSNTDLKNKADIEANITDLDITVDSINDWQSAPSTNPTGTGTESRFGDVEINVLETELTNRETYLNGRVIEVNNALGSVAQAGDGTFSGSGLFFDFYEWQNKRINKGGGSLSKYYNSLIAIEVAEQNLENLDSNRDEQGVYFVIQALTFNGDGTNTIFVSDTAGIEVTDPIKVFAEGQPVIDAVVQSKTATSLTLDVTVSGDYTVSSVARILKQN